MRDHPYVSETPGVGGGYPQVRGTRIPVWVIVDYYRDLRDIGAIVELFPGLSRDQVQGVLDYYTACPERVDEDRAGNVRALAELQSRAWPD
jgi:type III restriction enzyme